MALTPGQKKCIDTLDRSLVVAAGAGSGKTFTLTKRIVHAIESGAIDGIESVCAITFTNKAAGELKSRIKAELRASGLAEQALKVDEAWVSTIHGMCARILRAHAIELDIDPKFKMVDPAVADQLESRAIDQVLYAARSGEFGGTSGWPSCEAVDALFGEYPARTSAFGGASVEKFLQQLMDIAGANIRGFDSFTMMKTRINPAQIVFEVLESFEALADATITQKKSDKREAFMAQVAQCAVEIRSEMQGPCASDPMWALRAIDKLPVPQRVGTADYKEQVAETLDSLHRHIMELRLAAAEPHLETLVLLAQRACEAFDRAKQEAGVLDNSDLLVLASRSLANHPEIAAQYSDKFQLVMVDEFQDTDQMQVDMIKRLAGPGACRLCTVGDAQQSIYRFRGADVAVYRRHLEEVRSRDSEGIIMLPDNFRSHADVLSLVDRIFERSEMFGGEFMSLAPGRDESRVKRPFTSEAPRIQVQLTTVPYKGGSIDDARAAAAARIADVFADLHEHGHSAGEMAVLLGGMKHADLYAAALRKRGLACVITGGSVFSECPEAAIVLDLARVIANPHQTDALFNVLTSSLFELSADDLLVFATSDDKKGSARRCDLYTGLMASVREMREGNVPESYSPKLQLAVRVMADLIDGSGRSLVSRLITRAVVDSGWLGRLQAGGPEGLASAANVYKAIRMIESIESETASGPARTAVLYQALLEKSKEAPGALSATGGDFVRIMTIHSSKGLEFPIVAVGEFRDGSTSTPRLLACSVDDQVILSLDLQNSQSSFTGAAKFSGTSALYAGLVEGCADEDEMLDAALHASSALELRAALSERERLGDDEEAKRLLYVALTRAKEALVVSLTGKRSNSNLNGTPASVLASLVPALTGGDEGFEPGVSHFEFGGTSPAFVEHVALEPSSDEECADEEREEAFDEADESAAVTPFAVPAAESRVPVRRGPFAPAHEGVFSYSSIAEASHEGDVLDRLAQAFCVSVDDAEQAGFMADLSAVDDLLDEVTSEFDFTPSVQRANRNASAIDEDDGSWAYAGSLSADADKATDLGTAFHRLAQYAVATRGSAGMLEKPPVERVDALARAGNLDDVQRLRLTKALDRWFGSDVACDMAKFDDLRAEVPFFVGVPNPSGEGAFLEGEIDLLAFDGDRAVVVDYKTGGRSDELLDDLRRKHVLQAACYAYAIMRQGIQEVEAIFVRVERPRASDDQPQCVHYRFSAADLPLLETAIAGVYANR